jgi:N-acetylglutamate synthase-like GNAT family acetyltransferase
MPHVTLDMLIGGFRARTARHAIPKTFVALENDQIVGTASLVEDDMPTRPELTPWLAAVYVLPEFRHRGIGLALVKAAMREAEALGVERLYLFTPDRVRFYNRLGWKVIEHTEYRGQNVTIMSYEVKP